MTTAYDELLEASIVIDAPISQVWSLIEDPRRLADWSPQVESVRLRDGFERIGPGAELTHLNREGELTWTTHSTIVRFEPERELAFRITENRVVWSFELTPTAAGGTQVVQQRRTPDGISDYSLDLTENYLGGQKAFSRLLRDGMRQTLDQIRAAAERPGR